MNRCTKINELKRFIHASRAEDKRVGFVPTMGALHPGHASLIEKAAQACEEVVVSIFVNPTQFNNREDFETYPLTIDKDLEVAQQAGATVVLPPMWRSCMEVISGSCTGGLRAIDLGVRRTETPRPLRWRGRCGTQTVFSGGGRCGILWEERFAAAGGNPKAG